MSEARKLSLFAAILININIMIGAGIFVNTVVLARNAGYYGALLYGAISIILLPLIVTFARLMQYHKGGTFYDYGATLHPSVGFASGWSYFVAKLGSAALGIHVFTTLTQQLVPVLASFPILLLDCVVVFIFACLNMLNLRIGQTIQYGFLSLKSIPILFAIGAGLVLWLGGSVEYTAHSIAFTNIIASLPLVLYAFTGFEACCSLSRTIARPEVNGPRALLISYSIGVLIVITYQALFYGGLGAELARLAQYSDAFPLLLSKIFMTSSKAYYILFALLNIGIATSSLGAAYGIMYSNVWNLFVLAQKKYIFGHRAFTRFNKHHVPFMCIVVEAVIIASYLVLFKGNLISLQQVCSLGMITTYSLCTVAFIILSWRLFGRVQAASLLALASCALLLYGFKDNILAYGFLPVFYFALLLCAGLVMYVIHKSFLSDTHAQSQ